MMLVHISFLRQFARYPLLFDGLTRHRTLITGYGKRLCAGKGG